MKRANPKAVVRMILGESLPPKHKLAIIAILTYSDSGSDIDSQFVAEKAGIDLDEAELILMDLVELTYLTRLIVQKRNRTFTHYSLHAKILGIAQGE